MCALKLNLNRKLVQQPMESLLRINVCKAAMSLRTVSRHLHSELANKSIQRSKNMAKNITDDFVLFSGVVVPAGEKYDY